MNLSIVTVGSRGDVQPYVALGKGLKGAGHSVQIVTDPLFENFICENGLAFAPIRADPMNALQEDVRRLGSNPVRTIGWIQSQFKALAREVVADLVRALHGADGVVYSSLAFAAYHVAQSYHIPSVAAYLQPITPTKYFNSPTLPVLPAWFPLRGVFNRLGWTLTNQAFYFLIRGVVDECRKEILGLPPTPGWWFASLPYARLPIVYGYSPLVVPTPPDWGENLHPAGYWFLDQAGGWTPPEALLNFLNSGPAPVYVGLGSMVDREAAQVTQKIVAALQRAGLRAVLLGGWARLGEGGLSAVEGASTGSARRTEGSLTAVEGMPDTIFPIDSVPHDWLFPRMAAVVHHGGAGTTAAALRAGVPQVVIPYFADQPFWAERVYRLGVAARPLPRQKLTADRLAERLAIATQDAGMRQRAREMGEKIRAEDGVGNAVQWIEHYLKQ